MDEDNMVRAAGGVLGVGGAVGSVASAGTVAGLSMTGITSGLAAVGGLIGGGMLSGVLLDAAAPVVCALGAPPVYRFAKSKITSRS